MFSRLNGNLYQDVARTPDISTVTSNPVAHPSKRRRVMSFVCDFSFLLVVCGFVASERIRTLPPLGAPASLPAGPESCKNAGKDAGAPSKQGLSPGQCADALVASVALFACLLSLFECLTNLPIMSPVSISRCLLTGVLLLGGCSTKPEEALVRPSGWTTETLQSPSKEVVVLFAGKRAEGTESESHLVILHVPGMTNRQSLRGSIGSHLDHFWQRDPRFFLATQLQKIQIQGRHSLFMRLHFDAFKPPQSGKVHTYFFLTDAGLYQVSYSTRGEVDFSVDELLKNSLYIKAKEPSFAEDVIDEFVKILPRLQAQYGQKPPEDKGKRADEPN